MILYCVRHGESEFNAEGRIQGQLDTPLSARGRQQSSAVAAALAQLPIQAVFSSPLRRALETAQLLAGSLKLKVRTDERLKEVNAGIFQGHRHDELPDLYPDAWRKWQALDPDFVIPEGESRRQLIERGWAALTAIAATDFEHVAVVAHGNVLSSAIQSLLDIPPQRAAFRLYNGSISRMQWNNAVQLLTLNETAHLAGIGTAGCGDL